LKIASIYAFSGFEMAFAHTDSGLKYMEAVMNPQTFACLLWQLPVLTWLVILLMPGLTWHSALFGPWPLWLMASPALHLAIVRRRLASSNPPGYIKPGAQVLVFPAANPSHGVGMPVHRRAA
jgi:hypothetical protein